MNFLRSIFKREAKEVKNVNSSEKKGKNPQPGDGDNSGEKKSN